MASGPNFEAVKRGSGERPRPNYPAGALRAACLTPNVTRSSYPLCTNVGTQSSRPWHMAREGSELPTRGLGIPCRASASVRSQYESSVFRRCRLPPVAGVAVNVAVSCPLPRLDAKRLSLSCSPRLASPETGQAQTKSSRAYADRRYRPAVPFLPETAPRPTEGFPHTPRSGRHGTGSRNCPRRR